MKRTLFQVIFLLICAGAFASGTSDLVQDPAAQNILKKNCIRLGTSELVPIKFETACKVLSQPRLVQAIQEEFARSISKNGKVDFPIVETAPEHYYYINAKDKRTDLTELYKKKTDAYSFDYIVMASSKSFFGSYDVVIHLKIVDAGSTGVVYSVNVHAWPHNWLTRSSHKIGLTRRYFKDHMKTISWVAREVGTGLCAQEEIRLKMEQKPAISATPPSAHFPAQGINPVAFYHSSL